MVKLSHSSVQQFFVALLKQLLATTSRGCESAAWWLKKCVLQLRSSNILNAPSRDEFGTPPHSLRCL
jgi:hypothetical protein